MLGDSVGELTAHACTGTGESNIHTLEIIIMLQEFHFQFLATKHVLGSSTALAAKQQQLFGGEVSLLQHSQELLSHGTAGTYNCYSHVFIRLIDLPAQNYSILHNNGSIRPHNSSKERIFV